MASLPMQCALMKGPEAGGQLLVGRSLDVQADHPIQGPFDVVAAFIPCQSQQSLPTEFLLKLNASLAMSR